MEEECEYIKREKNWRNKQRTLVFGSRGITGSQRNLIQDLRSLMPHAKTENKWDKNTPIFKINDCAEMQNCNNVMFFESRRREDLKLWLARSPTGPSFKFEVLSIHTMGEIKLTGNCLKFSRPLLSFDAKFDGSPELCLIKELLKQSMGAPRNHPKSKPFVDHVFHFAILDGKIWFRHYQIQPMCDADLNDGQKQILTEIGPRFVLDPILCLEGAFEGKTLYRNENYISPQNLRMTHKRALGEQSFANLHKKLKRQHEDVVNPREPNPLSWENLETF